MEELGRLQWSHKSQIVGSNPTPATNEGDYIMFSLTEEIKISGRNTEYVIHIWYEDDHITSISMHSDYDKRYEEFKFRVGFFLKICNELNKDIILDSPFDIKDIKKWFINIFENK